MAKRIRVGVIGCGAISNSHCDGIRKHADAELVAVCDTSKTRADAQAKAFNVPKTYYKPEQLIADADLDAVTVALPNTLHAPMTIAALKAGKHVMCEKPFAPSFKDAKAMADAAKKAKKVFGIGMNQRFAPSCQIAKVMIERGELGSIYHGRAFWHRRFGSPRCQTWFVNKPLAGGGCLYDIGVHMLDLSLFLMDNFDAESVSGIIQSRIGPQKFYEGGWGKSDRNPKLKYTVDDFATALIKLKGGQTLELSVSWALMISDRDRMNVNLFGDKGGIETYPARLTKPTKVENEYNVIEPQGVKIRYPHADRFVNWIDAILGRDKLCATVEQSLKVQKVLDAIYASSASGKEVRIK